MVQNCSKSLIDWHLLEWDQSLWASVGGEAGFGSDSLYCEAWIWEEVDFWRWPMNPCALSCQQAWSWSGWGVEEEEKRYMPNVDIRQRKQAWSSKIYQQSYIVYFLSLYLYIVCMCIYCLYIMYLHCLYIGQQAWSSKIYHPPPSVQRDINKTLAPLG